MPKDTSEYRHWLLKAEPESRIEKGIDVKFSIEDFEKCKVTSWEGVRNHQAKNFLKSQMKLDHTCLFYASNCKVPGVAGLCKVTREGYPDHNAWDPKHPYFDPKSDANAPTWFMVDVEFISRLATFVPLALLQHLATLSHSSLPSQLSSVLTPAHLSAIASSALISRGRLSVQPCSDDFYQAVCLLGENGQGWVEWWESEKGLKKKGKAEEKKVKAKGKVKAKAEEDEAVESVEDEEAEAKSGEGKANAKTEAKEGSDGEEGSKPPARQSQKKKAAVVRNKNKRVKEETNQDDKDQKAKEDGADVTASSADDIARKRPRRGQK